MLEISLETATLDDVDAILRLRQHVATWLASRSIDLWQSPLPPDRLVGWIENDDVLVQRDHGCIAGAVALLDRDAHMWGDDATPAAYVHLLMVDRSHAGQDLGRRILERVKGSLGPVAPTTCALTLVPTSSACRAGTTHRGSNA